jgi:hypothetical protein
MMDDIVFRICVGKCARLINGEMGARLIVVANDELRISSLWFRCNMLNIDTCA